MRLEELYLDGFGRFHNRTLGPILEPVPFSTAPTKRARAHCWPLYVPSSLDSHSDARTNITHPSTVAGTAVASDFLTMPAQSIRWNGEPEHAAGSQPFGRPKGNP